MLKKIKQRIYKFEDLLNGSENLNYKFLKTLYRNLNIPESKKALVIQNIDISIRSSLSFEDELVLEDEIKKISNYFNKFYNDLVHDDLNVDAFLINESKKIQLII